MGNCIKIGHSKNNVLPEKSEKSEKSDKSEENVLSKGEVEILKSITGKDIKSSEA